MTVIESSTPGEAEDSQAMELLLHRVVLTTSVCRELDEASSFLSPRAFAALGELRCWLRDVLGIQSAHRCGWIGA